MERKIKILILSAACLAFIATFAIYFIKYSVFKFQIKPALILHNESLDAALGDFERDQKAVAESFLSFFDVQKKDAGVQLNALIPWIHTELTAPLALSPKLQSRLEAAGNNWMDAEPTLVENLDFKWLTDSIQFDHWSIWSSHLVKNHFAKSRLVSNVPTPDYKQLLMWVKLRYLHGLHNNDLLAAQSEIRHLAKLIETQETASASDLVLDIYQLESVVALHEKAREVDFQPLDADILKKATATIHFLKAIFHPMTDELVIQKLFEVIKPQFGLCGVIFKYSWNRSIDVFRPNQFKDTIRLLDRYSKASICRRDYRDDLVFASAPDEYLGGRPFFQLVNKYKFSKIVFGDSIGLLIDDTTRQQHLFVKWMY